MFMWQCYTSPELALDLLRKGIYVCGALSTKRSGWPSHRVVPAKHPMGASRTMQLGRMTVVSQKDTSTGVATILSTAHNLKLNKTVPRWDSTRREQINLHCYAHHKEYEDCYTRVDGLNEALVRGKWRWAI